MILLKFNDLVILNKLTYFLVKKLLNKMYNIKPDLDDKKILIVEYKSNLHFSWDNLENDGYEIDYAFSIKNAIKKTLNNKYSLLIINITLLMKEDIALDNFLKKNNIPTIFLIDNEGDKKLLETYNKSEFFDFLNKPIDFTFLRFKVETLLKLFKKEEELKYKNKKIENLNKIINDFTVEVNQEVEQKKSCFILQNAILNSIPANICLIDNTGIILTVNENWCEFGRNFGNKDPKFGVGSNYFKICKKAFKDGIIHAEIISKGINSILAKELSFFNMEYNLFENMWFKILVTPLIYEKYKIGAILTHIDISTQKKLELELRKNEEHFRSLTFNAPNIIIEVDRNLEITYLNRYENNFKINDILGKKVFTFVPSEFQEMVKNKIDGVFKTGIKDVYDTEFIYQNGSKKWFTTNVAPVKINGEINSAILLADDITARKEMEEKLKSNTNFLLEAQKLAKVGILELNLELEITHFSEQIFEIFNIEKKENLFLENLLEKVHIDDIDDLKKFINHIDLNEDIFEFRLIFDNSIIKYISATSKIKIDKSIILTLQDITQQKKHEITLEHIYKGVSNETGIDYLKKLTNFICEEFEVNYSYVARFYHEKNMINLLAFGGKEDLSRIFLNFDLLGTPCEIVLNTKESFYSNNLQEDFSKNDFIKIKNLQGYIGIPIFNNSNIIGVIVIMDDKKLDDINYKIKLLNIFSFRVASEIDRMISEEEIIKSKKKLEKTFIELNETQKQLIYQERLKALGEMASGIVHDFNNALTPILGYSELLLENKNISPNKMTRYLQGIRTATLNSASVVRGLREFYRKNSSNEFYENILINDIVKEVVELTKHKWKDQAQSNNCYIKIEINLEKTQFIFGNLSEIKEILTNLIFNAVDSITKKGKITISTRDEEDKVILEVSDTGKGMDEEVKSKIFEPFFTTKGNEGTGLGLSMIYGIVQRHKGKINIDSIVDKGTCFSISFPSAIKNNLVNKKPIQKKLERSLHILIVEDELDIQEIVSNYLLLANHTFEIANNGLEGLEKFQKGYFDLIITDYAMPEMNGRKMGDSIKLLAPDKPIILLTGFGDIIVSTNDKIDSIDYVICKPISIEDLEKAINYLF